MKPSRAWLKAAAQVAWLLLVAAFAIRFAVRHGTELQGVDLVGAAGAWLPGLAWILAAKGALSLMVYAAWKAAGADLGVSAALYTYNLSQLPKYVPGGVWPYLNRVHLARAWAVRHGAAVPEGGPERGTLPRIWGGLALETVFLLGGAVTLGTVALDPGRLLTGLGLSVPTAVLTAARGGVLVLLAAGWAVGVRRSSDRRAWTMATLLALVAWACIGLSFHAVVGGWIPGQGLMPTAGLFALAWSVGFVAVFSPAGLGVRELLLGLGLAGVAPASTVATVVVVHRMLYFLADVVCAGSAALFLRPGAPSS